MPLSRREFTLALAALTAGGAVPRLASAAEAATESLDHDMSMVPAHWTGSEQIAFVIYPGFTALDMVGPHHMLTSLMGSTTHIVAKSRDPVASDSGLTFVPSATFDECPRDLDIVCVPGGSSGTLAAMRDDATLRFLHDRGSRAKYLTSVCTGSLVLGAAGLLDGYAATSHWVARPLLPLFGATPKDARVVRDRNRITGAGVTAGIDFGLSMVGSLRDTEYAQSVQLLAEYAPEPPYDAGTPERAPPHVKAMMQSMFTGFLSQAESAGRSSFAASKNF